MICPILEARAGIQKYFRSFFGSNEDIQESFWNYLTFSVLTLTENQGHAEEFLPQQFFDIHNHDSSFSVKKEKEMSINKLL